jgi:predicted O-linked N-acetylglucosamine transferase (SPINDLY family)
MGEHGMENPLAEAQLRIAVLEHRAGRLATAEAGYRDALALRSDLVPALHNLGVILLEDGRCAESEDLLRQAVALSPADASAHGNLGLALNRLGRSTEALTCFRQAIHLAPANPVHHYNLGTLLKELGDLDAAIAALGEAVRLRPAHALGLNNLGAARLERGDLAGALACFEQASTDPGCVEAHHNRGLALIRLGRVEEAVAAFDQSEVLRPGTSTYRRAQARGLICDWSRVDQTDIAAAMRGGTGETIPPFTFLVLSDNPADQLACARRWAGHFSAAATAAVAPRPDRDKIRIGYQSGDFRNHAVAFLMAELIERHDRTRFEVFAYSMGPDDHSAMRRRLMAAFDHFIDIREISYADAARRIGNDGIDILIDMAGYTELARSEIPALRPAPIQVNYLGYPGTMGAGFIDYIIADPTVAPMADQPFYSERIVHLPDCYQPNDTRRRADARTPSRTEAGLPERGLVFCCFNTPSKITRPVFDAWMTLLKTVDGSVLWLFDGGDATRRNLVREATARGVAAERLIFAPRLAPAAHLARHALADLFLDTLPYNAHTTASDALWMGLPVVTRLGESFAGRVAASLLRAAGLPELVTTSLDDYLAVARRLATEPARLAALRHKLLENRDIVPLFDIARYTRHLEAAYLRMWQIHQAGQPPRAFAVPPEA